MPTYPHIERYYAELAELIEFGGSNNEQVHPAGLPELLDRLLPRAPGKISAGAGVGRKQQKCQPDGTIKDILRLDRGFWEAKGYPR